MGPLRPMLRLLGGQVFGSMGLLIGALVMVAAKNPAFMQSSKTRTDRLEDVSGGQQPLLQPLLALQLEGEVCSHCNGVQTE